MSRDLIDRIDEGQLIGEICKGRTELFFTLIEPYQRVVYASAFSIVNNAADAEEVAQEAFLKALKGLPAFRGEARFSTWLLRITFNEARGLLRRNRANLFQSLDSPSIGEQSGLDSVPRDLADWREIPSEALARKELRQRIEQTLQLLPSIYREVLVLRDILHLSVAEAAQVIGISKDLVKTRLSRARLLMREALAPGYDGHWTSYSKTYKAVSPW